jgi:hypothetical protein
MLVYRENIITKRVNVMDLPINQEQIDAWISGALIQNVMPDLDEDQREFLISGMMPGEFEALFGEEE